MNRPPSTSKPEPRYPYVHVEVAAEDAEETSALFFELGAQGVEERDDTTMSKTEASGRATLVASFESREDAEAAMTHLREELRLAPRYEEVVGDAWRDAWKEFFRPFAIADGIVVRPPWEPYAAKAGEKVLDLEPGRAFGTGLHETTRLVARALREHAGELTGKTILDVGCGSGVLAFVALALGAEKAVAIDVDPEAIDVTNENAARNAMTDRIEASTTPIEQIGFQAPVVLANIEARILIPMAKELEKRVAPGGLLLLSGILVPQKDDVRAAYEGMELVADPSLGEWTLLALRRR